MQIQKNPAESVLCLPVAASGTKNVKPLWPAELPAFLEESQTIAAPPQLIFPMEVFQQLDFYYRTYKTEFQLMGFVTKDEQNGFTVAELVLNDHNAGYAHADLDQDAFPALLDRLKNEGKDITTLRFQAHSHGKIAAMFSDQDIGTIKHAYACDWMISFLGNINRNYKARLDIFEPIPLSIALPIFVLFPAVPTEKEIEWAEALAARRKNSLWR